VTRSAAIKGRGEQRGSLALLVRAHHAKNPAKTSYTVGKVEVAGTANLSEERGEQPIDPGKKSCRRKKGRGGGIPEHGQKLRRIAERSILCRKKGHREKKRPQVFT